MKYGKYITEQEAKCKCGCGLALLSPQIVETFTRIREAVGSPLQITSATRCFEYNKKVGGKPNSAHLVSQDGYSHALDILASDNHIRFKIIETALKHGIVRIGIYKTFVHIDTNPYLPKEVCWFGENI